MGEYIAEDYIKFIELGRTDKLSPHGLILIAKKYRELEEEVQGYIEAQAGEDL